MSAREDLLLETKRLLAALNDENRELKSENTRLLAQCGASAEQLTRVCVEKEGLEKDLKQINFNLMQQLRVKLTALKEQDRLATQLREKAEALELQLRESRLAQESSAKEGALQREQIAALEGRLQQLTERLFCTEAEAGRYAESLNAAIAGSRDVAAKLQQDGAMQLQRLETALRASQDNEANLERVVEELRYELGRAREALRQSHSSSSSGGQRRALSARSEAQYAHEQVMAACSSSSQQLREVQQQLRKMESFVVDANRHMERAFQAREKKLREQTEEFIAADEALVAFLCQRIMERERELREVREELSRAICRLSETEKKVADAQAELNRHKAEADSLAALQQEVQTLRAGLQDCGCREKKLRDEVALLHREAKSRELQVAESQRLLNSEREQMKATRRSYEIKVDGVDENLRKFTTVVLQALRNFECTLQQQRRGRRISSSAGGVTLSTEQCTHSSEFAHNSGASSPSVLRVESSPSLLGHS